MAGNPALSFRLAKGHASTANAFRRYDSANLFITMHRGFDIWNAIIHFGFLIENLTVNNIAWQKKVKLMKIFLRGYLFLSSRIKNKLTVVFINKNIVFLYLITYMFVGNAHSMEIIKNEVMQGIFDNFRSENEIYARKIRGYGDIIAYYNAKTEQIASQYGKDISNSKMNRLLNLVRESKGKGIKTKDTDMNKIYNKFIEYRYRVTIEFKKRTFFYRKEMDKIAKEIIKSDRKNGISRLYRLFEQSSYECEKIKDKAKDSDNIFACVKYGKQIEVSFFYAKLIYTLLSQEKIRYLEKFTDDLKLIMSHADRNDTIFFNAGSSVSLVGFGSVDSGNERYSQFYLHFSPIYSDPILINQK